MAAINVRIDDSLNDSLREVAEAEGVTVSEFVRRLIVNRVSVERISDGHRDIEAPEALPLLQRHTLALLHRILALQLGEDGREVNGADATDHLKHVDVLERGFTGKYYDEVGWYYPELSIDDSRTVVDILEMFRSLTFSIESHTRSGKELEPAVLRVLRFGGFDGNHPLEGHMASFVEFLVNEGRWPELKSQIQEADNGNSHTEMLPAYLRMLAAHTRIMKRVRDGYGAYYLTIEELMAVGEAYSWR